MYDYATGHVESIAPMSSTNLGKNPETFLNRNSFSTITILLTNKACFFSMVVEDVLEKLILINRSSLRIRSHEIIYFIIERIL
jgi:hypothetical protein